MEDFDRGEERLRAIEHRTNKLADLLEELAKDRHEQQKHVGKFPSKQVHVLEWCNNAICVTAFEAASKEYL